MSARDWHRDEARRLVKKSREVRRAAFMTEDPERISQIVGEANQLLEWARENEAIAKGEA